MKPRKKRFGELVLRTSNTAAMTAFYRDIIGLEVYATIGTSTFLKITDDVEGHPQLLAIFADDRDFGGPENMQPGPPSVAAGTLHHFAFTLELDDFHQERERLESLGQQLLTATHTMVGWHSLYLHDPDGNSVEFVCFDPAALEEAENRKILASPASRG